MDYEYNFNCTDTYAAASVSWSTPNGRQHLISVLVGPFKPGDHAYKQGYRWYATVNYSWWDMTNDVLVKSYITPVTHEWCFTRDQAADKAVAHIRRLTNPPPGRGITKGIAMKDIEHAIKSLVEADRRAGFEGWAPLNPEEFAGRKPRARERRLPPTPHPWGFVGEEVDQH